MQNPRQGSNTRPILREAGLNRSARTFTQLGAGEVISATEPSLALQQTNAY